jgi:lysophospholipase L1-like esterase
VLHKDEHILFFGDSITDSGRTDGVNSGVGYGYVATVAQLLAARFPELAPRVTNRGTNGHRVYDLEARLQADMLDLRPTTVSILIGINDTWRRYDSHTPSPLPEFAASYRRILQAARERLGARLVVCEPFLLAVRQEQRAWREDLDPRIGAVRLVAMEFGATYVPLDGMFAAAACRTAPDYWLADGVHPTPAGNGLIAQAWIDAVVG